MGMKLFIKRSVISKGRAIKFFLLASPMAVAWVYTTPAFVFASRAVIPSLINSGFSLSSLSKKRMYLLFAFLTPVFLAAAGPLFD